MIKTIGRIAAGAVLATALVAAAEATVFSGNLYYTTFNGGQNVWRIGFSYDDSTFTASLGAPSNIASTNGADGIIFGANGHLLVGGQGSGNVYEVNPSTGAILATQNTGTPSFHLALDPTGNSVYTSNFGGRLNILNVPIGTGNTPRAISGSETGLTQVAFGDAGSVFYVNGQPNGGGNLGTIDLATGVTTRIYSGVAPAHGLIYDPFTDLMTMFGAGRTGTMNATTGSGLLTSGLVYGVGDFDQGAVDGLGHAIVAGSNALTFIDYSTSHNITAPDHVFNFGGFAFIDDVAPLVGPGSGPTVPEPATLALLGIGAMGLALSRRRRGLRD